MVETNHSAPIPGGLHDLAGFRLFGLLDWCARGATGQESGRNAKMSLDERIASRVESMREEILTTSSQLIQIESVNPRYPGTTYEDVVGGEGDAARFMAKIYKESGGDI